MRDCAKQHGALISLILYPDTLLAIRMKNVMKNRYRIQRTDYLFLIIAMTILNQMKCFVCSLRMVGLAGNAMEGVIDNASMEEDISW